MLYYETIIPKVKSLGLGFRGKAFRINSGKKALAEEVNAVIQREPLDFLDPELRGNLMAIGIKNLG